MTDRMRYETDNKCKNLNDKDNQSKFSPIEIIFRKYDLDHVNTLMLSYEFKNLIRDHHNIYYIIDQKKESNINK